MMSYIKSFNDIVPVTVDRTLYETHRLRMLYQCCKQTRHLQGDVAELGVYNGGTTRLIAESLPHKKVFALDTFEGMPPLCARDDMEKQEFYDGRFNPQEDVIPYLSESPNIFPKAGTFPNTIDQELENRTYAFLHFDGDLYYSCKAFLEFFWQRLEMYGKLFIDDYGRPGVPGVEPACREFFATLPKETYTFDIDHAFHVAIVTKN